MVERTQVPRKHIGKKTTSEQQKVIDHIRTTKNLRTLAEAKHEYFENQEAWDSVWTDESAKAEVTAAIKEEQAEEKPAKKRILKTIAETKLGVTLVLDHADCKELGFKGTELTRQVIAHVRKKLYLKSRAEKKAAKA